MVENKKNTPIASRTCISKSSKRLSISFHKNLKEEMDIYEHLKNLKGFERSSLVSKAIAFYFKYNSIPPQTSTQIEESRQSDKFAAEAVVKKNINENENFIEEDFELPPENQKKADPDMMAAISPFMI